MQMKNILKVRTCFLFFCCIKIWTHFWKLKVFVFVISAWSILFAKTHETRNSRWSPVVFTCTCRRKLELKRRCLRMIWVLKKYKN